MPQRRLLFVDSRHLTAYRWQAGYLHTEAEFVADGSSTGSFNEYLLKNSSSVFSILADVPEEGFQIEDIPHVSGGDFSALTKRRLGQYFYGTPFSMAVSLGREKAGRRDDKVLFAALTQPRHFEPWLLAMRDTESQLSGIYSAPLAITALLKDQKNITGDQLILSITGSGVRQTFFRSGQLRFSRLTALATGSIEETAVTCAVEAQKIFQYLSSQRLVAAETRLPVQVLTHPSQQTVFRAHCKSSVELDFEFVDLLVAAKKSGLKTLPTDSSCELLLMHELVRHPAAQQFAPEAERHFFRLWQIRSGLTAAAALIFGACAIYAGKEYFNSYGMDARTQTLQQEARADQTRYAAALASLPKLSVSTDDMRALVTRFEDVERRSPLMEAIFLPLSRALDATPGMEIENIKWQLTPKLPSDAMTGAQNVAKIKQLPLNVSGSYYAIADVSAQLPVAIASDHRAMLNMVNQFLNEIGTEKNLGVQMTQLPFYVESGKTIKGSADASTNQADAPRLAFRIVQGIQ